MDPTRDWTRRELMQATSIGVGLGFLGSVGAQSTAVEGRWPQPGYDGAKTNYNPDASGPETEPEVAWQYDLETDFAVTIPVVDDSTVYATTQNSVIAVDAEDGTEQWASEVESFSAPPAIHDNTLYFGTEDGIQGLSVEDGSEQQFLETATSVRIPPTIVEDSMYVTDIHNGLYSFNLLSGTEQWRLETGGGGGPPAVGSESIWFRSSTNIIAVLLNRSESDLEGTAWVDNGVTIPESQDFVAQGFEAAYWRDFSVPTIGNGTVYIPGRGIQAVDIQNGSEQWHFDGIAVSGTPALVGEILYVGAGDELADASLIEGAEENAGTLYALNVSDGSVEWTFEAGSPINNAPVATSRTLFVPSDDGRMIALSRVTGEKVWEVSVSDAPVRFTAVVDDMLFVCTEDGMLLALEESTNTTPTATPTSTETPTDDNETNGGTTQTRTETPVETSTPTATDSDDGNSDDTGGGGGFLLPALAGFGGSVAFLGGIAYLIKRKIG
jgi:outer membrane protein assembly factor BamB